ncbi:MAG: VOC family protein [Pseudomonadota bacterium]|nr:VOC family protein [Pseudomonadota bacterium]
MQKIRPCLWFDSDAENAARFYVSVFKNSKLGKIARYGEEGVEIHGRPAGSVMTVEFELNGAPFLALNGGPHFKFSEAVSFEIDCKDQEEVDYYWNALAANGGSEGPCGWLKDRFGLSWQVVPRRLPELMADPDKKKAGRVMNAMLKMKKIVVADLEKAAAA